ncbi:hypothetical protein G6F16_013150 [Rhizopus arrhizus]|nr:hypothetical protein G6F24_013534 [Rhizopus arrhizus]KAG1393648.1 hypothetical protein G6F58_012277 [Rhizopus delemar]KAG0774200.1 hypothetical protein G6F22_014259 [Rhizopus arrhizus]KAG0778403.1 hypothetical protein G6F21_012998 [Rhizopus arrhizus]KAG0803934.1 hypothetical protein G6F20_013095 [Rhizopus arrhizus]
MADRFIADNGLSAHLVMDLAQRFDLPGIGLLLDQEKAYDRVNPDYLRACLVRFGFPEPLISCISSLFFNTTLCINVNGFLSAPFAQGRGLRQGDPLSPLLFNLALEPLLRTIWSSPLLPGFRFRNQVSTDNLLTTESPPLLKALAYADDIMVLLSDPEELPALLDIVNTYERASNARLNRDKTLAVSLSGNIQPQWTQMLHSCNMHQWHDKSNDTAAIYLGFPLTSSKAQMKNFLDDLLHSIQQQADYLSQRNLSVLGRGVVANSLILSRIWHSLRVLAPTNAFLSKIRSVVIQFLSQRTFPAVSFKSCQRPRKEGGLAVLDPTTQHAALQLRWLLL